ncbi:MAG: c-type cytochrome [Betaproteobacteria bacterium]|nr:c-type cytochrome [Betaproteobacteria bacterium]
MKKVFLAAAVASGLILAGGAQADEALAKAKNCVACHAKDKKLVGPSFKDVAAKYATDKEATKKLTTKVIKGGSGAWGSIPMPPNAISEAEAGKLVAWVMSIK